MELRPRVSDKVPGQGEGEVSACDGVQERDCCHYLNVTRHWKKKMGTDRSRGVSLFFFFTVSVFGFSYLVYHSQEDIAKGER